MRGHEMAVLQLHAKSGVGQGLDDLTFHLDGVFFGHAALRNLGGANLRIKHGGNAMRVASGAYAGCRKRKNCQRGMARLPRLRRWAEGSWQSIRSMPSSALRSTSPARAAFDA